MVAYNMGDWAEIPEILRLSKGDIAVWLLTFGLTVLADLTIAMQVGMILAALLFIRKVSVTTVVEEVTHEELAEARVHMISNRTIPEYISLFRIQGPFLFGATEKIREITEDMDALRPIVILRLREMTAIDATGLTALEGLADRLHEGKRDSSCAVPASSPRPSCVRLNLTGMSDGRICARTSRRPLPAPRRSTRCAARRRSRPSSRGKRAAAPTRNCWLLGARRILEAHGVTPHSCEPLSTRSRPTLGTLLPPVG